MLRSWLTWGLSSALLYPACGGGSENELFGSVKPGGGRGGTASSIEPSLGEDGGSFEGGEVAIGGSGAGGAEPEDPPAGGAQDAGNGGAAAPGGAAPGEPAAGTSESGGGGESSGGAANGSGGTESGGTTGGTETGGSETGGTESGGTTGGSETGGNGTGGSTGGTTGGTGTGGTTGGTTGGSATGGQGGAAGCVVARAQLQKLLNEAQVCDPDARAACRTLVPNECECNIVPVGDPLSDATLHYLDQLERVNKECGPLPCVTRACADVVVECSPRARGSGQCVARER